MNNQNLKFTSILSRLCAVVIGLLGFGCSSEEEEEQEILCMYGTPIGHFEIKGEVTDEVGTPIPEVEMNAIAVNRDHSDIIEGHQRLVARDTTDLKGNYTLTNMYSSFPHECIKVVAMPLDDNFDADSTYLDLDYVVEDDRKGSMWYFGGAKAEYNFKLKRKTEE